MFEDGSIIGPYRVVRLLGEGGMGAVYEVKHVQLGVHYALKTYILDNDHAQLFRQRFLAEGRLLARLQHPNLVRVFDLTIDETTGTVYYVMDLVLYKDGYAHTLEDLEPGGADEDQIFDWFRQLCQALAYIHAQGIVHRDIKLNNILIAPDKHVVLSDFGISRIFKERLRSEIGTTRTLASSATQGLIVGTQGYMAPEIERGETATPASDVYALGVVFFKLLTGVWYNADLEPGATAAAPGVTNAARLLADFERPWKDLLPAMLAADPARRPTELAQLPARLDCRANEPTPVPTRRTRKTPLKLIAFASAAAVLVTALTAWLLLRSAPTSVDDESLADEAFTIPESVQ